MKTKLIKSLIAIFILCPAAAFPDNTWIVDQGGEGDFTTIQDCIEAASAGETCRVNAGTYVENIEFRYGKDLTVESSSGPEVTIIDGNSTYSVVLFIDGSQSILRGFTLQNGNNAGGGIHCVDSSSPTIEDCIITDNIAAPPTGPQGGGIYCYYHSSPIIKNCIISDNSAELGGGVYCNYHCSPMIINSTISNNTATNTGGGGIYCGNLSSARITDCIFSGNTATYLGGGILCSHSSPTITNCTFSTNMSGTSGGGIDCHDFSSPTINSCTFTENTAGWYGGGVWCGYSSSPTITNCIFAGNSAENYHGGGIACSSSSFPIIINCTLSGNTAKYYGGGIVSTHSSSPTITNCILWENSAYLGPELALQYPSDPSSLDVSYSDIEGGEAAVYVASGCTLNWGDGNINAPPLFVGGEDYHLAADSPCIDTGTSEGAPHRDIDGDSRPQGAGYDMGSDEYTGVASGNYNLANIATASNEFQLWLDLSINEEPLTNICGNYDFEVRVDGDRKTNQISCECLENEPTGMPNSMRYRIWFRIDSEAGNARAAYFERGRVHMCNKATSECSVLKVLNEFSVWGTTFDITKHAWQFRNKGWNKPGSGSFWVISWADDVYKAGDLIDDSIAESQRRDFWRAFGSTKERIPFLDWKSKTVYESEGGCYGLVSTAISNFTHQEDSTPWGSGDIDDWMTEIENNWNYDSKRSVAPFRPFQTNQIYDDSETYDSSDSWTFQSAKKIMYYFVSQPYFNGSNWVGKDHNDVIRHGDVVPILKSGSPVSLRIRGTHFGHNFSHRVAITQLISWNGDEKYIIWDNEYPHLVSESQNYREYGPYLEWYIHDASRYEDARDLCHAYKSDGNGWHMPCWYTLTEIPKYMRSDYSDSQNIYNLWPESSSTAMPQSLLLFPYAKTNIDMVEETQITTTHYPYPDHIEIIVIGSSIDSVNEKDSGYPVTLVPYGAIIPGQAVIKSKPGDVFNFLYLPADITYRIEATKYADFAGLKVFVTIPNTDGTAERINYENVETGENDATNIFFFVGRGNTDKDIRRSIQDDLYGPDYDDTHGTRIDPPQALQAICESGTVNLTWINVTHPGLAAIRVIRKEGGFPQTPDDGIIIYEGSGEAATDSSISVGTSYYYAAYSIDVLSNFSEPAYVGIDTSRHSIYGSVTIVTTQGVAGAQLLLKDSDGRIIHMVTTGSHGGYTLSNVENGNYTLEASHPCYGLQDSVRSVFVNEQNVQEDFIATPVPTLFLIHDFDEVVVGSPLVIQWAYRNINNSQHVDIALNRGQGWEIIDYNVDIVAGQVEWQVSGPNSETAILRISLSDDILVYDEDSFRISMPPIIQNITFDQCISELCAAALSVAAHDPEGGNLTYTWEALDGGTITIIGPYSDVEFDPPGPSVPPDCDPYRVKVIVTSDASGLATEETINIYVKLAGDVDGNGVVNVLDKVQVRNHFGESGPDGWIDADVDCNGIVNVLDKVIVRNQFGQSGGVRVRNSREQRVWDIGP